LILGHLAEECNGFLKNRSDDHGILIALAGALLLQESFTGYQIAGAIVIIAGVYTANIKK